MFKVNAFMQDLVITVTPETAILDAIRLLASRGLSGLPVVDATLAMVGFLSEKDVLHLLKGNAKIHKMTVADFMSRDVIHFDLDSNLVDLSDCLEENAFRRVPITDKGKLVGIVSRSDVIKAILALMHEAEPAARA